MMENNIKKKVIHLFAQTILMLTFSVFLTSCAEEKQISEENKEKETGFH